MFFLTARVPGAWCDTQVCSGVSLILLVLPKLQYYGELATPRSDRLVPPPEKQRATS